MRNEFEVTACVMRSVRMVFPPRTAEPPTFAIGCHWMPLDAIGGATVRTSSLLPCVFLVLTVASPVAAQRGGRGAQRPIAPPPAPAPMPQVSAAAIRIVGLGLGA